MSERQEAHAGGARDLRGLAGGRVQRLLGPVALLLRERGLVDQDVGAFRQDPYGFGGSGVARR